MKMSGLNLGVVSLQQYELPRERRYPTGTGSGTSLLEPLVCPGEGCDVERSKCQAQNAGDASPEAGDRQRTMDRQRNRSENRVRETKGRKYFTKEELGNGVKMCWKVKQHEEWEISTKSHCMKPLGNLACGVSLERERQETGLHWLEKAMGWWRERDHDDRQLY